MAPFILLWVARALRLVRVMRVFLLGVLGALGALDVLGKRGAWRTCMAQTLCWVRGLLDWMCLCVCFIWPACCAWCGWQVRRLGASLWCC